MAESMLARIAILSLGGTIAMTHRSGAGVEPTLSGNDLVAAVPELSRLAHLKVQSVTQKPGAHLQFTDIDALCDLIRGLHQDGHDGVVITQGTDTIEEMAFALDVALDVDLPVVVTGAMRNPTVAGADGAANLLAAVRVAADESAKGMGVLVVMNDEIHAARFVRKTHSSSPAAFTSHPMGPVGALCEGRVRFDLRLPSIDPVGQGPQARPDACVALLATGIGDDGRLIDAAIQSGFDGLVLEATGGGHVNPQVADALERAARQVPVLFATRTRGGETLASTYGFAGGEIDLQRRGLIRAGWLDGIKARIALMTLLRQGVRSPSDVDSAFRRWGGGRR